MSMSHNIFDGAESEPVHEDQIVLIEWDDNTEQVFGPYTLDEARQFIIDFESLHDNIHDSTILPLRRL